jgi:hypothetical protein
MEGNYDKVSGVVYERWDADTDTPEEPNATEVHRLEEMYVDGGRLELRFADSDGTLHRFSVPLHGEGWTQFLASAVSEL